LSLAPERPAFPGGTPEQTYRLAASCHNRQELLHAQTQGADFAVLAPVSATKIYLPVYALGGLKKFGLDKARQSWSFASCRNQVFFGVMKNKACWT
jgi:hypothetical protein